MLSRNPILLMAALACAPFVIDSQTVSAFAETAPAAKLVVGEKAPEYKPTSWVQGEPVTSFEKGKTYIIECWATWCGPCIAQIPHLTELQAAYGAKGLVIIGTNVWDKDADNAAAFVKKQGDKMPYRIAFDDKTDGLVTKNWLVAGGVTGIPHAFVVHDGILIWHGHPGALTKETVESMLAGTFDSAKAEKERVEQEASHKKVAVASKKIETLIKAKDFDGAMKAADELEAVLPDSGKVQVEFTRARILAAKGEKDAALAKLKKLVADKPGDAIVGINVAMTILRGDLKNEKGAPRLALDSLEKAAASDAKLAENATVKGLIAQANKAVAAEKAVK